MLMAPRVDRFVPRPPTFVFSAAPARVHCAQLPRCIAQYTVGHTARLGRAREILARHKLPLHLVGSSYDGPGINDTIMSAKLAVIRR